MHASTPHPRGSSLNSVLLVLLSICQVVLLDTRAVLERVFIYCTSICSVSPHGDTVRYAYRITISRCNTIQLFGIAMLKTAPSQQYHLRS